MISLLCIDDKNRPSKIPESKWVTKGSEYTLLFAIVVLPQRQLAFQLEEIDLDDSCSPFEYFLANRFAFNQEDLEFLQMFIKDCTDINLSMKEITKQINERTTDTGKICD